MKGVRVATRTVSLAAAAGLAGRGFVCWGYGSSDAQLKDARASERG